MPLRPPESQSLRALIGDLRGAWSSFHHRELKVLVAPPFGLESAGLLVLRDGPARLDAPAHHRGAEAIPEQVALGSQPAQRVLELVREDQFEMLRREPVDS